MARTERPKQVVVAGMPVNTTRPEEMDNEEEVASNMTRLEEMVNKEEAGFNQTRPEEMGNEDEVVRNMTRPEEMDKDEVVSQELGHPRSNKVSHLRNHEVEARSDLPVAPRTEPFTLRRCLLRINPTSPKTHRTCKTTTPR